MLKMLYFRFPMCLTCMIERSKNWLQNLSLIMMNQCRIKELVGNFYDDEVGESNLYQQNYSSLGDISVLYNMPEPSTVQVRKLCRLLRIDKRTFMDILDTFFIDGRILLNNFLEGKQANIRNRLMESDISLQIRKYESDSATTRNSATYDGDLYRLKHLVKAGADPSKIDYDGRTPLVN